MEKEKRIEIKDRVDASWTGQLKYYQAISRSEMDPKLVYASKSYIGIALRSHLLTSVVKQIIFISVSSLLSLANWMRLIHSKTEP